MNTFISLIGKYALPLLNSYFADRNRDKPPFPIQPVCFQPHTTSSLSIGKNASDSVDVMRLDALGQTPHPDNSNEMDIDYICSQYGLVGTYEIKSDSSSSHMIFSVEAAPCFSIESYGKTSIHGVNCYFLPPVAVISNCFGFWRGPIEFRLDFVCTTFHVCKIWVSFQPNVQIPMSFIESKACAGIEIDLSGDRRQHTFSVPYLADRPFWPRYYSSGVGSDVQKAPGLVVAYVMASLTCTASVSSSIYCNLYVRGGKGLEFAVPCQPAIGLSYNPRFAGIPADHQAWPFANDSSYAHSYVGKWRNFVNSEKAILRWGTLSDEITQFSGSELGYYYRFADKYRTNREFRKWTYDVSKVVVEAYFVPFFLDGYHYMALCDNLESAKSVFAPMDSTQTRKWRYSTDGKSLKPDYAHCYTVSDTTKNTWSPVDSAGKGLMYYLEGQRAVDIDFVLLPDTLVEDYEMISRGESDERVNSGKVTIIQENYSTGSFNNFGENFSDLKDLCRRYQPYWKYTIKPNEHFGVALAAIPIVPTGLHLEEMNPFNALCRDGLIPIISSGYRYYRGGLRFKILCQVNNPGSLWVQVRPDRRFRSRAPIKHFTTHLDAIFNHGYASSFQATSVNPTMSIEVPFYQPGEYGLLQMTGDVSKEQVAWHVSLGELVIGCMKHPDAKSENLDLVVFYSIADDCRFSTFQGFPPMIKLKETFG